MIKKPKILDDWEREGPPKVCFNCDFNGIIVCLKFDDVPPDVFQQTPGACDQWENTIPF